MCISTSLSRVPFDSHPSPISPLSISLLSPPDEIAPGYPIPIPYWCMITRPRVDVSAQAKYPDFVYAADAEKKELSDAARVWKHFNDESSKHDIDMVERWKDTINILLVFAGLFSAVVTAFVVDTSANLEPDHDQTTSSLIYDLVNALRIANGLAPLPPSNELPTSLPSSNHVTTANILMYGLWYTSLTLSLLVAVTCVLVGQWLSSYLSTSSAPPEDVAKTRQFRFQGLRRWGVGFIIGSLPFLLIVALFLFLWGLVIFLFSFNKSIAIFIAILSGAAFCLYLISAALPAFYISCPYRTSLSAATFWVRACLTRMVTKDGGLKSLDFAQQEQEVVTHLAHIGADCLFWMFDHTQSPVIDMIVVQALAGLCPDVDEAVKDKSICREGSAVYYWEVMFRPLRNRKMFAWSLMNSIENWCWNLPDEESAEFMSSLKRGIILRVSKTILYLCFLPNNLKQVGKYSQHLLPNTYVGWSHRMKRFCNAVLQQILPKFHRWMEIRYPRDSNYGFVSSPADVERSRKLIKTLETIKVEVDAIFKDLESLPESPNPAPKRSKRTSSKDVKLTESDTLRAGSLPLANSIDQPDLNESILAHNLRPPYGSAPNVSTDEPDTMVYSPSPIPSYFSGQSGDVEQNLSGSGLETPSHACTLPLQRHRSRSTAKQLILPIVGRRDSVK